MNRRALLTATVLAVFAPPAAAYPVSAFTIWTIAGDCSICTTAPACGARA